MEQYKNECERESTLLGYLRGRERARVKMESVSERACERERERVEFNNKGQSPERYIAGRRRQYFIIRTKSATATGRISNNLLL